MQSSCPTGGDGRTPILRGAGDGRRGASDSGVAVREPGVSACYPVRPEVGMRPLNEVAAELGIAAEHVLPWGRHRAKIDLAALEGAPKGRGRLVLVSAINPTPAGEGKTTVSVGLAMGLRRRGVRTALCLREPSLGPVFGVKGGATGGGKAQVIPADAINLHFTGDLHAITAAHNLLSAIIDNALHFGTTDLDPRRVRWGRALDMNDRSLRRVIVGLGGSAEGVPRETRFDITAASEVMAVLCLASGPADLVTRLGRIVVGTKKDGTPVTADDLGAAPAMAALLIDALMPNLVQTAEGGPAFVHGGPFANIAHGCNSLLATRMGLHHADVVVTEAGFGLDLGGEKFLDLKCRIGGHWPELVVVVATLRALKMHGGAPVASAGEPNRAALEAGFVNLAHHLDTVARFGLPAVVAINRFGNDPDDELQWLMDACEARGVFAAPCDGFAKGGEGALDLADIVTSTMRPTSARYLYELESPIAEKLRAVVRGAWGADDVVFTGSAPKDLAWLDQHGFGHLPVCLARAPGSITGDPARVGRPTGFTIAVREVRLSAGAGFVVGLTGDIMTMPGLPKVPAAARVTIGADGTVRGLMQGE